MSPVHAQLLSGLVGRFQKQAGNRQSLVATESGSHSGQPTGRSSTETWGLPGGQDVGLQPGPQTLGEPRSPGRLPLCNLTSEHFHQNFCKIFTPLLYVHSSEAKSYHGLLTTLLKNSSITFILPAP